MLHRYAHLISGYSRSVYTLSSFESLATSEWIKRVNSNSIESIGSEQRNIPLDGLRWLEAGLPFISNSGTLSSLSDKSLDSGYLPHGYHLALPQTFRKEPSKIEELNPDGTFPGDFYNPPHPFTRRMWASGEYTFHERIRISIKEPFYLRTRILKVEGKDLEGSEPKIFFTRRFEWGNDPRLEEPAISEDRTHVFLTQSHKKSSHLVIGSKHPDAQFSLTYRPPTTLLFRFSAVSQNDHKIHYEDAYCRDAEGLPGLAVHGPLTALLLTRLACLNLPESKRISHFRYRATHPIVVNNQCTLSGVVAEGGKGMHLWAIDAAGNTGMKATATLDNVQNVFIQYPR